MGLREADLRDTVDALRSFLPRGEGLPEEVWTRRHRAILALLWAHAAVIPVYAVIQDLSPIHAVAESLILPAAAVVAAMAATRRVKTLAASFGLLSASAILVHLSGGLIEMHFHFFVMVAVVALYQDWTPFLAAIGYVLVHHGVMGSIDPGSVYNHPAAIANPWRWAGVHSLFIGGISAACLVTWRLNESYLAARRAAEERLREETRVVETLNEVGKTLAAELDSHSVVQHVTDAATQLTGAQFGAFFYNVVNEAGESYMLYTISGVDPEAFAGFPMPRNTPVFAPTFSGEQTIRLDDVTKDPRYGKVSPHFGMPKGHLPVRSYLAVPVRSRTGPVIGGLFFGHEEVGRFGDVEERLATGIAAHAAIAIDNANLYESERRALAGAQQARRRVEIMAEASRVLSSSLELPIAIARFARLVAPTLADRCDVYLIDEDGSIAIAGSAGEQGAAEDAGAVARALEARAPVTVTGGVVVPLVRRDLAIGALALRAERGFDADEISLIEELGRRVAIAVENAQLYATKRTAADTLQHSLLPDKLPEIPGLSLAARYVPGGAGVDVGGDWYDVVALRDGTLALVMGDVVGRGVMAASLMGQLRNALRAYAVEGDPPGTILGRLNDLLYDVENTDNPMATLLYAVYDPETGTLRIANAGHPPPVVLDADGGATLLESAMGVPIGAMPGARYSESLTTLRPGATLLLYTDGLVEDRDTSLDQGLPKLCDAVRRGPRDPDALCDWILAEAPARGGHDDVALLLVRPSPIGERLELSVPTKPSTLKPLRATLRRWLTSAGASEEETFDILVAAGEACTNAIQHAGPGPDHFEVLAELDGGVLIEVRDHGRWRKQRPSLGGRGLEIMREFMDDAVVESTDEGTTVRLKKLLSSSPVKTT